ncbi:MAG TPA: hypothetical protein DCP67_12315, partial [Planctomycetaceae bacterium]|nr:hypothetical protein [Planctomycetaceae bacterium]
MTGHDCLYKQWLGVESPNPSFYDLFEIGFDEPDLQVIKEAADRALSKVRSFRPGAQAKQWAMLLDELTFALKTLTDSELRSTYDQQLERGELVAALRVETSASTDSEQQLTAELTEQADLAEQAVSQLDMTPETHAPDDAVQIGISNSLDMVPTGATEVDPMAPVDVDVITAVPPQPELVTPAAIQSSSPSLAIEEETTTSSAAAYHAKSKSRTKGVWIATGALGVAIAGIIITLQVLPDSGNDTNNVAQNQNGQSESSDTQSDDEGQESQDPSDNTEDEGGGTKPSEPNEKPNEDSDPKPDN